jgi:hypothetical protein
MADRDTFIAECERCKVGTVGWLMSQLIEGATEPFRDNPGLQTIVIETPLHFGMGDACPNLEISSIGRGEDQSVCIELSGHNSAAVEGAQGASGGDDKPFKLMVEHRDLVVTYCDGDTPTSMFEATGAKVTPLYTRPSPATGSD